MPSQFDITFFRVLDAVGCHPDASSTVTAFVPQLPSVKYTAVSYLRLSTGSGCDWRALPSWKVMLPPWEAAKNQWLVYCENSETWPTHLILPSKLQSFPWDGLQPLWWLHQSPSFLEFSQITLKLIPLYFLCFFLPSTNIQKYVEVYIVS